MSRWQVGVRVRRFAEACVGVDGEGRLGEIDSDRGVPQCILNFFLRNGRVAV